MSAKQHQCSNALAARAPVVLPPFEHRDEVGGASSGGDGGTGEAGNRRGAGGDVQGVYRMMISDEILGMMAAAAAKSELAITASGAPGMSGGGGALHMGDKSLPLTFRFKDAKRDTDVEEVFSHRDGSATRSVGVISGFADVKRPLSKDLTTLTKRRTIAAENDKKKSTTLLIDRHEEPRAKRGRGNATKQKRPRSTYAAPRSSIGGASTNHASPLNGLRSSSSPSTAQGAVAPTAGGISGGSLVSRRLPAALPSATPSPHVSPPGLPSGANSAQRARARAALGSAAPGAFVPRSTPPPVVASARPSPAQSRGPSPARVMTSAPSSPRIGSAAPSGIAHGNVSASAVAAAASGGQGASAGDELSRHVVHLLALQDMSVTELRRRLSPTHDNFEQVRRAAKAVATSCEHSKYSLKPESWRNVTADYEGYSAPERDFVRRELAKIRGGSGASGPTSGSRSGTGGTSGVPVGNGAAATPATGSGSSQGSAVSPSVGEGSAGAPGMRKPSGSAVGTLRAQLPVPDAELDEFVERNVTKKPPTRLAIRNEAHEADARKQFEVQWNRYVSLHRAMEQMQRALSDAREERRKAKIGELAGLNSAAEKWLVSVKDRWGNYSTVLNNIHSELGVIKQALALFAGGSREKDILAKDREKAREKDKERERDSEKVRPDREGLGKRKR